MSNAVDGPKGGRHFQSETARASSNLFDEVEETCSRVIILNEGTVIAEGSVAEIKRRAAPRTARVRIPDDKQELAQSLMKQTRGVAAVSLSDDDQGWLHITFESGGGNGDRPVANGAVRALLDAGIPLLAFELEGGRLSDAFLYLTAGQS